MKQAALQNFTMSNTVEASTIVFLSVICLSCLADGHKNNRELIQAANFQLKSIEKKDPVQIETEKNQGLHIALQLDSAITSERKPQENVPNMHIKQPKVQSLAGIMKKDSNRSLNSNRMERKHRLSTHKKKSNGIRVKAHIHIRLRENKENKFKNSIQIKTEENPRGHFKSSVPFLWKRSSPPRRPLSDKIRPKTREPQPKPSTPSKFKESLQSISDSFSKAKQKVKLPPAIARTITTTKRVFSGRRTPDKSLSGGLGNEFTSGYTQKPSGLGQFSSRNLPAEVSVPSRQSSQPFRQSTAEVRDGSQSWDTAPSAKKVINYDELSETSPAKSPEVRGIWDFIDRHSKNWAEKNSPPRERSPPRLSPPRKTWSPNFQQRELESRQDEEYVRFISTRKSGWGTPDVFGVSNEGAQMASSSSRKPQPRKRSPLPLSSSSSPDGTSRDPGSLPRKLSNQAINERYDAILNRVRSADQSERLSPNKGNRL